MTNNNGEGGLPMDMRMMMADSMVEGMDMEAMQNLMEAAAACEQACTMCVSSMMGMDGMETCSARCMNCADMSNTMMRMMMRPAGMEMDAMMAAMQACMMMAKACSAECSMHADMNDHCRMCAKACDELVAACEAMMASMRQMS
jgi:hypothetical protein